MMSASAGSRRPASPPSSRPTRGGVSFASALPVALSAVFYVAARDPRAPSLRVGLAVRRRPRTAPPVSILKPSPGSTPTFARTLLRSRARSSRGRAPPRPCVAERSGRAGRARVPRRPPRARRADCLDARALGGDRKPQGRSALVLERAAKHELTRHLRRQRPGRARLPRASPRRARAARRRAQTSLVVGSGQGASGRGSTRLSSSPASRRPCSRRIRSAFERRDRKIDGAPSKRPGQGRWLRLGRRVLAEDDTLATRFAEARWA